MKYFKNEKNELFVDPIVEKHVGLIEITKSEFDEQLAINNEPTSLQLLIKYQNSAKQALIDTKETVERITEAVSLGKTTLTAVDVVAFMQYRADLRAEISATKVGILPVKSPYPVGT